MQKSSGGVQRSQGDLVRRGFAETVNPIQVADCVGEGAAPRNDQDLSRVGFQGSKKAAESGSECRVIVKTAANFDNYRRLKRLFYLAGGVCGHHRLDSWAKWATATAGAAEEPADPRCSLREQYLAAANSGNSRSGCSSQSPLPAVISVATVLFIAS